MRWPRAILRVRANGLMEVTRSRLGTAIEIVQAF